MFLRNSWYVAASVNEIGRKPLGRIILGEPVVMYRTEDGTPVALEDGVRFAIREGGRTVGAGVITEILA